VIATPAQALALVRRAGVVTQTPVRDLRSLTFEVTGETIRGSWWSHPLGKVIFSLATALDESPEVAVVKLVEGKVTFVHRTLFAPLYRVVTDAGWRTKAMRALSSDAQKLSKEVEKIGELRLDALPRSLKLGQVGGSPPPNPAAKKSLAKARNELETRLLVHSEQEHTDSGAHQTRLRTWERWAPAGIAKEARRLSFDQAMSALEKACGGPIGR